jgi:hypothetical protein
MLTTKFIKLFDMVILNSLTQKQLVLWWFVMHQSEGKNVLTFPASLAMNPVSDDVLSCFTSYVSNSLPSHTIAAFIAGKLSSMVLMWVG